MQLVTGCQEEAQRITNPTHAVPSRTSAYRASACWFTPPYGPRVECGYVTTPAAPGSSETVEIAVAQFIAPLGSVAADPLVVLTGGPGQEGAALTAKLWKSIAALAGTRDVVAIDQRGTGASHPNLACPEADGATDEAARLAGITACRQRLVDAGVDLATVRTAPNAADVEAVRLALSYPAWNLFGTSYGTRLALTVIRDHRAGVRSAVLSSVVPLEVDLLGDLPANAERAFGLLFQGCAAQPSCAASYPSLEADFRATVAALDASPASVDVGGTSVPLSGDAFLFLSFELLYDASSLPYLPATFRRASMGDYSVYAKMLSLPGGVFDVASGMHLSTQCADELPFADFAAASAGVDSLYVTGLDPQSYVTECGIWDVPASPAVENEPVSSDVPILMISGSFDPVTPPAYATRVAASFPNAISLEFAGSSHSTGFDDACSPVVVPAFLRNLTLTSAEAACTASSVPPTYR